MSEISFSNRTVIITGAGRGLGRTYALEIGRRGGNVVVNDLGSADDGSATAADQVVEEVKAAGGNAVAEYSNVATEEGAQAIVKTAVESFGRVDALINNAGILRDASLVKMTDEQMDSVMAVHLRGSFLLTRAVFPIMKQQEYGRIVFTTSAAGLFGNFGQANYAAAKMGLVGLSSVVGIEGARSNILSNTIAPGAKTRMTANMGDIMDALPPESVAPMAVYLASEACQTTQHIYSVGGGRYARVFVGVTPGVWAENGEVATVDEIASNIDRINATDDFIIPRNIAEEAALLQRK